MSGSQTENYVYKCCWTRCRTILKTFSQCIEHWNSEHILCRESLCDIDCEVNFIKKLECEIKHEKTKLQVITTVRKSGIHVHNNGWEDRQ